MTTRRLLCIHLRRERRIHSYARCLAEKLAANPDYAAEVMQAARGETQKQKDQRRKSRVRWDARMRQPKGD